MNLIKDDYRYYHVPVHMTSAYFTDHKPVADGVSKIGKWLHQLNFIWDSIFKNGPIKICGRQPLKNLKWYGLLSLQIFQRLFSTHFTWSILEYLNPFVKGTFCSKFKLHSTCLRCVFRTPPKIQDKDGTFTKIVTAFSCYLFL